MIFDDFLDKELMKKRLIFLDDDINQETAGYIIKQLYLLDSERNAPITMCINSSGGSIPDGLAIIDAMNMITSPITTIIHGEAHSMAAVVAICGKTRLMTKHSTWLIHDVHVSLSLFSHKSSAYFKQLCSDEKSLHEIVKEKTKLTEEQISDSKNKDLYLDAQECLKYGVVDNIVKGLCIKPKINKSIKKHIKKKHKGKKK